MKRREKDCFLIKEETEREDERRRNVNCGAGSVLSRPTYKFVQYSANVLGRCEKCCEQRTLSKMEVDNHLFFINQQNAAPEHKRNPNQINI